MSPARRIVSATCSGGTVSGAEDARPGLRPTLSPSPCLGALLERRVGGFLEVVQVSEFQAWTHPHSSGTSAPRTVWKTRRRASETPPPPSAPISHPGAQTGRTGASSRPLQPKLDRWLVRATRHLQAADLHQGPRSSTVPHQQPQLLHPLKGSSLQALQAP